jgi:hypothetical protein
MGSLLGPADALYHWLGTELAAGIGVLRAAIASRTIWRCMHDVAACDLATAAGGRRFIASPPFGGACAGRSGRR